MSRKKNRSGGEADSDDDAALFRRAVAGAKPLQQDLVAPRSRQPPPRAQSRRRDEIAVLQESLDVHIDDAELHAGERLRFRRPEIGERTLRRLTRGRYSIQSELDLHGLTLPQAESALRDFIDDSLRRGYTCVRIVHGKGLGSGAAGPVLKAGVNRWLRRWREVLAFASARQVDGGSGAVSVLLQKR
jgi:DNA-nicking Smr family endonuclease